MLNKNKLCSIKQYDDVFKYLNDYKENLKFKIINNYE